jgi:hypothetical protein
MRFITQPGPANRFSFRAALTAAALSAAMLVAAPTDGSAQIVKRAVQGGLLGAGIGAIAGGGKGAGKGAAIGAAVGAVVGASERAHAAPPPPRRHGPRPPAPVYQDGLVYNIQTSLTRLGYNPGPIDGQYGQRTAEAIRSYEYNNQLPITGQPSPGLYNHMVQHGG